MDYKILIADDEPEIRNLLRLYLENENYHVIEAEDGQRALDLLRAEQPALCILDIMMPKIDGYHVLQQIRKESNIPVIILSAKDADSEKILGLNLGADDYLAKPFNPLEAVARVNSNIRRFYSLGTKVVQEGNLAVRDLVLNQDACTLKKGDKIIQLTSVEYRIMELLMLLILGALNAMFPSPLHEMVQAALEQMQKNFMHTVSAGKTNFSFYELNRGQAILLFLVAFVVVLVILTPYVLGAVCFAKITIKEFRQIQREREEEQKEFDRKRNLMLSDIAHDLRTPMTTVNGYAKALADGMVVEPEKQLEYLQAIQNKSARMNDLIHLLFEYVKLDSEGFSLDRKETDLSELLRENAALIYADFEDAGMEFEIDIPEEVVSVSVDPIQFSRVITNLLNNAMKHNESGTHIKIGMYRKNGYIYILVADSGRRIPGELAEHLFEPFTKGDVSRKSGSGSGLGLSIAKKIIEMHGFQMDFIQQLDEKKIPQIAGYTKEFVIQIADDSYDSSLTA